MDAGRSEVTYFPSRSLRRSPRGCEVRVRVLASTITIDDMRRSTLLFHVVKRLIFTKWRDPGDDPELHLFGQLKRITKEWLDNYLVCKGGTYPALLMYQELADMACERIAAAITRSQGGKRPIKIIPDAYNPTGSTMHVNFTTSKTLRWHTSFVS